jgi:hypothetical protein
MAFAEIDVCLSWRLSSSGRMVPRLASMSQRVVNSCQTFRFKRTRRREGGVRSPDVERFLGKSTLRKARRPQTSCTDFCRPFSRSQAVTFHCLLNFIGKRVEMPMQPVEHVFVLSVAKSRITAAFLASLRTFSSAARYSFIASARPSLAERAQSRH